MSQHGSVDVNVELYDTETLKFRNSLSNFYISEDLLSTVIEDASQISIFNYKGKHEPQKRGKFSDRHFSEFNIYFH